MARQALLLADDPLYREWLDGCLEDQLTLLTADARDAEGLVAEIRNTPDVGLIFVQFEEQARERADVVEGVLAHYPDLPVVAIGGHEDSEAVLAAMRAGVRDYLVRGRDDENLTELVQRVLRRTPKPAAPASGGGHIYGVVSTAQVPGVPFLAAHLALPLAQDAGSEQRVLLLDLTTPGGASLVFLDADQGDYTALDALADADRCDETLVDTAFARYREQLYLLCLPEDVIAPPRIDPDKFSILLERLAGIFGYIVVAADAGIDVPALTALISRADRVLLLSNQSVLQSRQNKHLLQALRQSHCRLDRVGLGIDNYQARLGLDPERIASLLDLPLEARFTGRPQARIEAMNSGELLHDQAPKDAYVREVRELLSHWIGEAAPESSRPGLLGRLSSWLPVR